MVDLSELAALPALRLADVAPMLHLTERRYLGLAGNRVADAGPLGNLSELVWLRLPGNPALALDAAAVLSAGARVDAGADAAAR